MHDISELEKRGLASVFVASTEFKDAAEVQANSLGFEPAAVFVPHPIQDRTDDEMREMARDALADILGAVSQRRSHARPG